MIQYKIDKEKNIISFKHNANDDYYLESFIILKGYIRELYDYSIKTKWGVWMLSINRRDAINRTVVLDSFSGLEIKK